MTTSRTVGISLWLAVWLVLLIGRPAQGTNPAEEVFRKAGMPSDTDTLIEYLRGRSAGGDDLPRIDALVHQLGSAKFKEREQAGRRLVALGAAALPALRRALAQRDVEVVRRAKDCIKQIEGQPWDKHPFLPRAAVRLLIERQAKGAVEALLGYLPFTDDPELEEEIYYGLDRLGFRGGEVHPALLQAVTDRLAARRAVAACIIGRQGTAEHKARVRKLLMDKDPRVRLRAAQGLLAGKDSLSVPTLIALLTAEPLELAWQAEELLCWVAAERGPKQPLGDKVEERQSCQAEWTKWWQQMSARIDWVALLEKSPRRPGLMLVPDQLNLMLYGCDGRPRYKIRNAPMGPPWMMLPNRYLLSAYHFGQECVIAERDASHQEVWTSKTPSSHPFAHLRHLTDGRVLVLGDFFLLTLDGQGNQVKKQAHRWSIDSQSSKGRIGDLGQLYRLDNVRAAPEEGGGRIDQLDPTKKEPVRTIILKGGPRRMTISAFAPLANGDILVSVGGVEPNDEESRYELRLVGETGQVRWRLERPGYPPECLIPLRNGNIVLISGSPFRGTGNEYSWISEIDGDGRVVWEMLSPLSFGPRPVADCQVVYPLVRFGFGRPRSSAMNLDQASHRILQLKSQEPLVRKHAVLRLARLKLNPREAAEVLRARAKADKGLRRYFTKSLAGSKESVGLEAIPELITTLNYSPLFDNEEGREAITVLKQLGPKAVDALLGVIHDSKQPVDLRASVAKALGNWLDQPRVAVVIRRLLEDKSLLIRECTLIGICRQRRAARAWVPEIGKLLKRGDKKLSRMVLYAFTHLGEEGIDAALPYLAEALGNADLRDAAFSTLWFVGRRASETLRQSKELRQALLQLLPLDGNPRVVVAAADILGLMGTCAKEAVPVLMKILKDRRKLSMSPDCASAARALGSMGSLAAPAARLLLEIARDTTLSTGTRQAAIEAMGRIGPKCRAVVPGLQALLRTERDNVGLAQALLLSVRSIDPSVRAEAERLYNDAWDRSKILPATPDLLKREMPR